MIKKEISLVMVFLIIILGINFVCAEKIGIEVKDSYVPGDEVKFKATLYDDNNNKINGQMDYFIQNYYSEIVEQGVVDSGNEIIYNLATDAYQGPWKIIINYNDLSSNQFFNVGELEKADIRLEGDTLILKNIGNTIYEKKILIYIGQEDQTADVVLDFGQEKRIRLTAPTGNYDIKVIEGNEGNALEFKDVSLTGNVVGLERVLGENGFWQKNKIVVLFLGTLLLVVVVIAGLKGYNKYSK